MASTPPQQILTRFLTSASRRIWIIDDATNTHILTNRITSPSHSLHRPLLLRCRFSVSNTFLPCLSSMASAQAVNPQSTSAKTVRVVIKGVVQGVFYRNWTIENATELGLNGWVRNRSDGTVEALFSGNPESLMDMEQRCRRGPPDAMVTGLDVFPSSDNPGTGFERKPTV